VKKKIIKIGQLKLKVIFAEIKMAQFFGNRLFVFGFIVCIY